MDFWVIREGMSLKAYGPESASLIAKLPFGKPVHVEAKQRRNARHSALYWVLCHRIADAVGTTSENVSDLLKIGTGHCTIVKSKKYGEVRLPQSISFAKMDQAAFREFFDKCLVVILTEWGIASEDVREAVKDLLEEKVEA
jgi:hypothetical protein